MDRASSAVVETVTVTVAAADLAALQETVARLERENRLLNEKLHYLLHQRFGRSSERGNPAQGALFDPPAEDDSVTPDEDEDTVFVEGHERKRGGRRKPPKDLPRVRVEHDLPEAQKQCTCGACLDRIGEEISEQYDVIPPVFQVLEHVRFKYACPACDASGVKTAPKAPDPLPRHQVSPGLLAWLGTGKYVDGLPLHRQAAILEKRFGVPFTSTTVAQWMINAHERLFAPLLEGFEAALRARDYVHADETTMQVLDEPDRYAWQKSYLWIRVTGTGPPVIRLTYSPSRAGAVASELFAGYSGYLQIDAYSGYNGIIASPEVTAIGCWAHARRKFDAVLKSVGRKAPEATVAKAALDFIRRLYRIEREIKDRSPAERSQRRQTDSRAILEAMAIWRDRYLTHAQAHGGALAKAFTYLNNQWDKLIRYVEDERVEIDNNRAERHIRPIANGRKAWLFARSQRGAHASAGWFSVVETAKANGLEPYHYLRWLFTELPHYLSQDLPLDPLLPWNVTTEQIGAPNSQRG